MQSWSDRLWGNRASVIYLLAISAILLLTCLGGRELWTQEHRWADIVSGMFFRHDFLHPYLNDVDYYDKPLLSYWLIVAVRWLSGEFSAWTLRLPSALAGVLAVWSIYRLGSQLKDRRLGLLAGWLLVTTFYFVFWARTSSADMLNLAGTLFAVSWYVDKKNEPSFFNYAVFFLIVAITSLCKGLVGAIVPVLAIFPMLISNQEWKKHLRVSFFLAMIPAALVYFFPFWASAYFGGESYSENGLYLVYRENILRYFQPFDHQGPIYTYFIFLPIYLLPWAFFFIPALISLKSRWKSMSSQSKWMVWSLLILFLFFTFSGSRRNYYVLPIVPFAILMTADWILSVTKIQIQKWTSWITVTFVVALFLNFDVIQPLYYANGGTKAFADRLKEEASKEKPWSQWQFVMLDPESKARFYLQMPPQVKNIEVQGKRDYQTEASLLKVWPILHKPKSNLIFISRKKYVPLLKNLLPHYRIVEANPNLGERILKINNLDLPVAFIPI